MGSATRELVEAGVRRGVTRRSFLTLGGAALLTVALSGCRSEKGDEVFKGVRTVTDHAGREVEIPTAKSIDRVYFTSGLAEVFIFSLIPEIIAGNSAHFTTQQLDYLPERLADLPSMGSLSGNGEIDREELLAQGVQVVFSISGVDLTAANISDAERLQEQTGIPVLLVDGSFSRISEAYRFLGDVLGCEKRATELAGFLEGIYADVTSSLANLAERDKVSVYYAEGPLGLQTEPDASQHALAFLIAGARNVAAEGKTQALGMSNVSLEQVLSWNPEVIVAWDDVVQGGADEIIRTKDSWQTIRAVQDGRVYTMPCVPFAWCDRPPGVNRFIGIQWLANMLYPDLYDVDMVEETQRFYSTVYWRDITTDQALAILGNSYPPLGRQAKYTPSADFKPIGGDTGLSAEDMAGVTGGGY